MVDNLSPEIRTKIMSSIKGKNTRPEMIVRKLLFHSGIRFRLHQKGLPGKPDIVLKKYRAVIFVHGCFWHMHNCHIFKMPSTRTDYWKAKLERNIARDEENTRLLIERGWRVLIVRECVLVGKSAFPFNRLEDEIKSWLQSHIKFQDLSC